MFSFAFNHDILWPPSPTTLRSSLLGHYKRQSTLERSLCMTHCVTYCLINLMACLPISWFKPSCKHRISSGICHGWHWPRDNPSKQSEIAPNFVWLSQTISSHIDPRLWGRSIFLLQDSTYQRVSVQTYACSTFVNAPQQVHCWFWLDLCTLPYQYSDSIYCKG